TLFADGDVSSQSFMPELIRILTASDPALRNRSLEQVCAGMSVAELMAECGELDSFRRDSQNLYERVRALFFLYAIHRFHLPATLCAGTLNKEPARGTLIPFKGYEHLLQRRFEEAIESFLVSQNASGPNDSISSALAAAYYRLGFQTLADQ